VVVWVGLKDLREDVACFGHSKGGLCDASQEAHCQGISCIITLICTKATDYCNLTYQYLLMQVMAYATVGFCFEGDPESGGEGLLIGLNRFQAFKAAQRENRGTGGINVVKGDCLLTDYNVTGTNVGSPDKPKLALRALWEFGLLPSLDTLVATGGQCKGALVIHQEDNAGCIHSLPQALTITVALNMFLVLALNLRASQGGRLPHLAD
jgi:hypothetical protein